MGSNDDDSRRHDTDQGPNPLIAFKAFADQQFSRVLSGLNIDIPNTAKDSLSLEEEQAAYARGFRAGLAASQRCEKYSGTAPSTMTGFEVCEAPENPQRFMRKEPFTDTPSVGHGLFDWLPEQKQQSTSGERAQDNLSSRAEHDRTHSPHAQSDREEWQNHELAPFGQVLLHLPWKSWIESHSEPRSQENAEPCRPFSINDMPRYPLESQQQFDEARSKPDQAAPVAGSIWSPFDSRCRKATSNSERFHQGDEPSRSHCERWKVDEQEPTELDVFELLAANAFSASSRRLPIDEHREQSRCAAIPADAGLPSSSHLESTSTTITRRTLEDGSIQTKTKHLKRFPNGQEETMETEHNAVGPQWLGLGHDTSRTASSTDDSLRADSTMISKAKKGGWFWS